MLGQKAEEVVGDGEVAKGHRGEYVCWRDEGIVIG